MSSGARDRHCAHGAAAGARQAEEPDVAPASSLQAAHTSLCSIVHGHRRGALLMRRAEAKAGIIQPSDHIEAI